MTGTDGTSGQSKRLGWGYKTAAIILGGAAILLFAVTRDEVSSGMLVVIGVISMILIFAALSLYGRGEQHQAPGAAEAIAADGRPPILYLRSFDADETAGPDEEALAAIMQEAGPFVAIGRPGDKLPPLGAARFYVEDALWQDSVAKLLHKAALVLLLAGKTEGLFWELRQCRRHLSPSQLVVLIPRDRSEYNSFRQAQQQAGLDIALPDFPEPKFTKFKAGELGGMMHFTPDWQGQITVFEKASLKGSSYEFASSTSRRQERLRQALQPVVARTGLAIREPKTNFVAIITWSYMALGFAALVIMGALIAIGVLN